MENGDYTPLREQLGGRKKVCVVGFCGTNRDLTPYGDPSYEIWGLNRGHLFMERADRWFEMHSRSIITSQKRRPGKHVQWLNTFPGPVYMHQKFDEIKTCVVFPLKELADFFGVSIFRIGTWGSPPAPPGQSSSGKAQWLSTVGEKDTTGTPYLSSSIAYEIALAIYEGFEEIHLYGVDLNTEAEYAWQKPGVEFLLGYAAGHGIKVMLPDNCPLLKGTLYGRGFLSEKPEEFSYMQLETRLASLQNEMKVVLEELNRTLGAHVERQFLMEQMMPGIDHELADERHKKSQNYISELQARIAQVQGKIEETAYWLSQTMAGQEPSEAMIQLGQVFKQRLIAEGPQTDYEELVEDIPSPIVFRNIANNGQLDAETANAAVTPVQRRGRK